MFDVKTIPATPTWARRLLRFNELKKIDIDPKIVELSKQDLLTRDDYPEASDQELRALQYIKDHGHRALILDDGSFTSRELILQSMKCFVKEGCKLILSNPSQHIVWAQLLQRYFPDESITVVTPHKRNMQWDELHNCNVASTFDGVATGWIVTSYSQILYNDILNRHRPVLTICEEINPGTNPPQRYNDALQGIFCEVESTMFIYNTAPNAGDSADFQTTLKQRFANGSQQNTLLRLIGYLWPIDNAPRVFEIERRNGVSKYLYEHGYGQVNMLKLLTLFGVCIDLLEQTKDDPNMLYLKSNVLVRARGGTDVRSNERGMFAYTKTENTLARSMNMSIQDIYKKYASKEDTGIFEQFKSNMWCNYKAQYVKHLINQMTLNQQKTLVIAENQGLIRGLRLALECEELATSKHYDNCMARYLYPSAEWMNYADGDIPPIYNQLCVSVHDLSNTDLVETTQVIILAEIPQQLDVYQGIVETCQEYDIKLIHPIIADSFEDYLLQHHREQLEKE